MLDLTISLLFSVIGILLFLGGIAYGKFLFESNTPRYLTQKFHPPYIPSFGGYIPYVKNRIENLLPPPKYP